MPAHTLRPRIRPITSPGTAHVPNDLERIELGVLARIELQWAVCLGSHAALQRGHPIAGTDYVLAWLPRESRVAYVPGEFMQGSSLPFAAATHNLGLHPHIEGGDHMTRASFYCVAAVVLLGMAIGTEKVSGQSELDGAWEVTYALSDSVESNQAGLYIFQGEYYSVLHVWNNEPRPLYEEGETRESIDHDKLLAIVLPVEGNSGKFEIEGSTLTMSPLVAISPNFMRGESRTYSFSISGDELTLRGGPIAGRSEEVNRVITLRRLH